MAMPRRTLFGLCLTALCIAACDWAYPGVGDPLAAGIMFGSLILLSIGFVQDCPKPRWRSWRTIYPGKAIVKEAPPATVA